MLSLGNVAASATYSATGTEASNPVQLSGSLTLTDAVETATVAITAGFVAGDILSAGANQLQGTKVTQSYNAQTGVLTLTGPDTVANFQIVLDSIGFATSSQTAGNRTVTWTVESATATETVDVTVPPPAQVSFYPAGTVPANGYVTDQNTATVGQQFTVAEAGLITAVLCYNGDTPGDNFVAGIYQATVGGNGGTLMSSGTLTTTTSGWQTIPLNPPVEVQPGQTYTAAYFYANAGGYADDKNFFVAPTYPKTNNGITFGTASGVYAYGSALEYPTSDYLASNYYVDIVFEPGATGSGSGSGGGGGTPGTLSLGVFSPWNPSLNPPGDDFGMWGGFVGRPASSLINMGMGIQTNGDWAAYTGSASAVVQGWANINAGQPLADGQNEVNLGPFPNGVGATLTIAGAPESVPIGQGPYDQYWLDIVNSFNGTWSKVRWRLCWEFEGGWYPWGFQAPGINQQTYAADYIATYRRMVAVIRSRMPEATFVFCAADGQTMNGGAPYPTWEECYPGDDVVDRLGIDVYCANGRDQTVTDPTQLWNQEAAPGVARSQALALAHKKPWGIYETAVGAGAVPDNPYWIAQLAAACNTIMQQGIDAYIGYWNQLYSNATLGLGGLPHSFAQYCEVFPNGFHA